MNNIPIFIINLKQDSQKKKQMQIQLDKLGLKAEFIEAVDGQKLGEEEKNRVYDHQKAIRSIGRRLTDGEIGCALSHRSIYKTVIDKNYKMALILEDDVSFDESLVELINKNVCPDNCDIILLGHFNNISRNIPATYNVWFKKYISQEFVLRVPAQKAYGTHGYIITQKGAKKLYELTKQVSIPIDHYTGNVKFLNVFILEKPIIQLDDFFSNQSTISEERNNYENTMQKSIIKTTIIYKIAYIIKEQLKLFINKYGFIKRYK